MPKFRKDSCQVVKKCIYHGFEKQGKDIKKNEYS